MMAINLRLDSAKSVGLQFNLHEKSKKKTTYG